MNNTCMQIKHAILQSCKPPIEQMTDTDLIQVCALSDDPQEMAAARQELNDRCFGPADVDAEVERFFDERRKDKDDFYRACAEGWML